MASVRVFFLLATLAVVTAANPSDTYDGNEHQEEKPYPMPNNEATKPKTDLPYPTNPTCRGCEDAKRRVLEALGKCCQEVSKKVECLCPTMNTLISAGVPLKEVCYDDMACKKSQYSETAGSLLVDSSKKCEVPEVCNAVVDTLRKLNKCFSDKAGEQGSGGNCFAESLIELGFKNPTKVIEKLHQSEQH